MPRRPDLRVLAALAAAAAGLLAAGAGDSLLRIAVATTVDDSGLMEKLRASYQSGCKCTLAAVAAGSGQALEMLRRGDVDAAITHAPELERQAVAAGAAAGRFEFMANDFIVVGPKTDPAGVSGLDPASAFAAIARVRAGFVSRSDNSGTHRAETRLWRKAGIDRETLAGKWYLRSGTGMARTLMLADELNAYALSDSATFAVLATRRRLQIRQLTASGRKPDNRYSIVTAAAASGQAGRFAAWLLSKQAQQTINRHRLAGAPLFIAPAPLVKAGG